MAIATRSDAMKNFAKGLGYFNPIGSITGTAGTAATAGSGYIVAQLRPNSIGTTLPSTLETYTKPTASEEMLITANAYGFASATTSLGCLPCIAYKIGTIDFTATGDKFTHDAATFPVLRTKYGVASSPVNLIPYVIITTVTATTAPVFRLRTVAGAAGYVNQDGTSVIGTKTMTLPSAATAAASGYIIRLEDGDAGVQDITNVEVTTSGTSGAAAIYGIEFLGNSHHPVAGVPGGQDHMFGGLSMGNITPAVATSGTATSILCSFSFSTTNSSGLALWAGVRNV